MKPSRSFASDNNAGVHPEILEALTRVNEGHVVGYGADPYTASAVSKFREHFGEDVEVFFVFNGPGPMCSACSPQCALTTPLSVPQPPTFTPTIVVRPGNLPA